MESSGKQVEEVRAKKDQEEAQLQEIMDGLRDATKDLRDKLEATQIELGDAERGVSGQQTEKETVQLNINIINERVENINKNLAQSREKLSAIEVDKKAMAQSITDKEKEKVVLAKQIGENQASLAKVAADEVEAEEKWVRCILVLLSIDIVFIF